MFSQIGQAIFDHQAILEASDFKMGLEIEMQRVDETGHLSQEPYRQRWGTKRKTRGSPTIFWKRCLKS
ncbi:hypothetical protein HCY95_01107 [Limosilactobacillus fermentum]|uniref:Glutamate--cysteine ligase n=1 Tax=Limosilactobacillus fermentum TaxID=1613 RepID=A0AAJ4GED9_LIMFE|nr:hypothetical protein HCY95_01107 [Limosilactobacillus fermentum]